LIFKGNNVLDTRYLDCFCFSIYRKLIPVCGSFSAEEPDQLRKYSSIACNLIMALYVLQEVNQ
jgi:hypothetical protein